jgi:hypothetical protein
MLFKGRWGEDVDEREGEERPAFLACSNLWAM